jgi:hypothetical protein
MSGGIAHPDERAEAELPFRDEDIVEARQASHIDEGRRPFDPKLHPIDSVVPPTQEADGAISLGNCANRLCQRRRPRIAETLHRSTPLHQRRRSPDRRNDPDIGAATAEVAAHILADLVNRVRMSFLNPIPTPMAIPSHCRARRNGRARQAPAVGQCADSDRARPRFIDLAASERPALVRRLDDPLRSARGVVVADVSRRAPVARIGICRVGRLDASDPNLVRSLQVKVSPSCTLTTGQRKGAGIIRDH